MSTISIPPVSLLERKPPVVFTSRLALREGNAKKPVYQIHKWWARRLGSVFRSILIAVSKRADSTIKFETAFYKKQCYAGFVVLDPFVGGGTSVVEAAKCGASVIGVDIDPVACFVTRAELQRCDSKELSAAFRGITDKVKRQIVDLYTSTLEDGTICEVVYAFWVEIAKCTKCKSSYPAHPHYQLVRDRKNSLQTVFCNRCCKIHDLHLRRRTFHCSDCNQDTKILSGNAALGIGTCPDCGHQQTLHDRSIMQPRKPKHILFALQVIDSSGKVHFKRADESDQKLIEKARRMWRERAKQDCFVPNELIPEIGRTDRRPICFGYKRYRDLFNERQLLSLSLLAEAIGQVTNQTARELLAAAFSDCLASNNMFCYYAFDYDKLTPLFGLHAYHKVTRPVENNVWGSSRGRGSFEKCYKKMVRGKEFASSPYEYKYARNGKPIRINTGESISLDVTSDIQCSSEGSQEYGALLNGSSERLDKIADKSIHLVLSDPPYYDNLAYSELSDFYHVWLKRLGLATYTGNNKVQTPMSESLYVSGRSVDARREHATYQAGLRRVLSECNRVLKDDGIMVFTFHHRAEVAWEALGNALIAAQFRVTNVFPIRSEGKSQFHSSAGNLKWDAVFCCRKRLDGNHRKGNNTQDLAKKNAAAWAKKLRVAKLNLTEADKLNLTRAFKTMYRCNAGILSGEAKQ